MEGLVYSMALAHNTSIVRDDLVFYYDMNNVTKSWRGKPTTNNATNGRVDYYSRWASTTNYPPLPFFKNTDVYLLTDGNNYFGDASQFSITDGNTYTVSYWYYIDTTEIMQHFMLPLNGSYVQVGTEIVSTFVNTNNTRNVSGNIGGWVWGYKTFTVSGSPVYMRGTYTTGGGDSTPSGQMYITNVMIETGSIPSGPYGYTGGTRSNTQSILDLTGTNTITASSLTYNVDGTFSFNGSSDVIRTSNNIFSGTDDFTICAMAKTTNSASIDYIFGNYNIGNNGAELYFFNSVLSQYIAGTYVNGTIPISSNQWYHIASTRLSGTVTIYINGVLDVSAEASNSIPVSNPFTIGNGDNYTSEAFGGNIPMIQVYSRALTSSEVQKNFNAIRDRYGI